MGSFNGSGTFVRSYSWTTDAANGIDINAGRMDTEDNGFAGGLSNCITRDGQGVPTAGIAWGGQDLTSVGSLSAVSLSISGTGSIGGDVNLGGTLVVVGATALAYPSSIKDGSNVSRLIGYRNLPFTASTTGRSLALTDVGEVIPATGTINVPTNASAAFAIGDIVGVYNNSGSSISITASGGVTLRLGGSATTGTRTLAQRGLVSLLKIATDEWVALNGGIS